MVGLMMTIDECRVRRYLHKRDALTRKSRCHNETLSCQVEVIFAEGLASHNYVDDNHRTAVSLDPSSVKRNL